MNTQNLHPLDISIASNPGVVTFYVKISPGRLLLKKFSSEFSLVESSSFDINLSSLFLANLKTKFNAIIFLVHLT